MSANAAVCHVFADCIKGNLMSWLLCGLLALKWPKTL